MSARLQSFVIRNPGILGATSDILADDPRWIYYYSGSTRCRGLVFNDDGQLATRKSIRGLTASGNHGDDVESIHEFIQSSTSSEIIHSAALKIYTGTTTLSDITGTITTPTANDWQFLNFNNKCIGVQQSHTPIVYTGTGSFANITAASGSLPTGNCAASAFGRLWVADSNGTTVKFSGVLDETDWGGAGAGSLDTLAVWPDGADQVTAISEWQDRLLIIGIRSILVYAGPEDPTASTFQLEDIIRIGTRYRDSVVPFSGDLAVMTDDGLKSVARAQRSDNLDLADLCPQIREALITDLGAPVKGVYSPQLRGMLYIMGSAAKPEAYLFDTSKRLENGTLRVLPWGDTLAKCAVAASDGVLYFGVSGNILNQPVADYDLYITSLESTKNSSWQSVYNDLEYPGEKVYKQIGASMTINQTQSVNTTIVWFFNQKITPESTAGRAIDPAGAAGDNLVYQDPMTGSSHTLSVGVFNSGARTELVFGDVIIWFKTGRIIPTQGG